MNAIYDYKRFAILYVDDEEKSLKYFTRAFSETFRIFTANNAQEGYRLLEDHQDEIGVVMTDQRMPGEQGVQFLERARRLRPQIIRILATAFADLDAAILAVNSGAIYKYVTKPWDPTELETTLKRCLEFFSVQVERDLLLREKMSVLHQLLITDRVLSLGVMASGLSRHVRHALEAVSTFMELAPSLTGAESVNLDQLREPAFLDRMHRQVHERLKFIVGLLDDLSEDRGGAFRFDQEVRLNEALDEALKPLVADLATRKVEVANLVPSDLPALLVDQRRFRKLFALLLRHELVTLREGGVVRFEASLRPASGTRPEEVDVFVTDNGTGLPAQAILSLFDPLQAKPDPGSEAEMYLMAVYFIVYHHGGRIQVGHRAGRGLALTMTLPLRPQVTEPRDETREFLVRAMTNERLWDRLLAGM
ncbi:MAG: hybrid sensor histidine kinase/response regulator [Verrucomicrobiales bacterium]|nr:hybrid sensor histidine kinase/response regulator [Verrucomicrobiales bacterium]